MSNASDKPDNPARELPLPDPNRQPGDQDLYNEDTQGNVFYDKNTEIKRETEFHDSTAAPVTEEPKVTKDSDEFGKKGSKP